METTTGGLIDPVTGNIEDISDGNEDERVKLIAPKLCHLKFCLCTSGKVTKCVSADFVKQFEKSKFAEPIIYSNSKSAWKGFLAELFDKSKLTKNEISSKFLHFHMKIRRNPEIVEILKEILRNPLKDCNKTPDNISNEDVIAINTPERMPEFAHRAPVGLTNLGSTCYLNSSLQLLYNSEFFYDFMAHFDRREDILLGSNEMDAKISEILLDIFNKMSISSELLANNVKASHRNSYCNLPDKSKKIVEKTLQNECKNKGAKRIKEIWSRGGKKKAKYGGPPKIASRGIQTSEEPPNLDDTIEEIRHILSITDSEDENEPGILWEKAEVYNGGSSPGSEVSESSPIKTCSTCLEIISGISKVCDHCGDGMHDECAINRVINNSDKTKGMVLTLCQDCNGKNLEVDEEMNVYVKY